MTNEKGQSPAISDQLGHYRILKPLGEGGMGKVYLARDTRLKRDVAIKVLPENLTNDAPAVERFMREAYAASALNHPNILTIFDIGKENDTHFIATEFVDGQTLREKMRESLSDLSEILDISIQVGGALAAAHSAGIVHRDIKPENIMIRNDGYAKVLDFGIAKLTESKASGAEEATLIKASTTPGMILGTVSYMSPEQARGKEVDARSDIFSLGIVIYEMAAGRQPFMGETVSDILAAILKSEPLPLSEVVKNIPLELEWSIAKALCKDRDERYQTIKGFLADLKRLRQRLELETEIKRGSGVSGRAVPLEAGTLIFAAEQMSTRQLSKTRTRKAIDSLAVLPFINESADPNAEYLSDGITESIINVLLSLPKVRVVPRSTVFRYKNSSSDPMDIGRELGVRAVFTGRLVQMADSVVITTELTDVANEEQLWGEQYRRKLTDIFVLQGEIAEDISEKLRIKLTGAQKKQLKKRYTENTEAYQFYLKGRYFVVAKRTEEWIKKGIEYFQKAIDLDPNYALAYSGIAEAYGFLASSTGGWQPREAYPKAKSAALKALDLDDALSEAHCTLGFSLLLYDWDFAAAEKEFQKAIKLKPNFTGAIDGYGFYLKAMGRPREAIEKCKQVQQIDPLSTFAYVSLGYAYYFARDYEHAIDECRKALEMDKYSTFAYRNIGLSLLQQKKFDEAIAALGKAVTFSSGGLAFESHLGFAYGAAGRNNEAAEVLKNLEDIAGERYVPAYNFAMIYTGLGDNDKAIQWLEKACEERSGFMPFLQVEPMVDGLRDDPRFHDLLQRVGLI